MCAVQETAQGRLMGYGTSIHVPSSRYLPQTLTPLLLSLPVIGKAEGQNAERHGHVTALSVAPEYRRLGLSRKFMAYLERASDDNYRGLFVDLYVRCVNHAAIAMYESFGYSVYRRVRGYYDSLSLGMSPRDEEDGFGESFSCLRPRQLATGAGYGRNANGNRVRRHAKTYPARSDAKIRAGERAGYRRQCARSSIDGALARTLVCYVVLLMPSPILQMFDPKEWRWCVVLQSR